LTPVDCTYAPARGSKIDVFLKLKQKWIFFIDLMILQELYRSGPSRKKKDKI
jgi:hypothetical protein